MKLVILESPFRATRETLQYDHVTYARRCLRDSILRGEAPLASHLLYTQEDVLDDSNAEERALGIAVGHAWFRHADLCAIYTDYGVSDGMVEGITKALFFNVPRDYRKLD